MRQFRFYKRDEIQKAKKEKRNAVPTFGITCTQNELKHYVGKYELDQDWIWS